MKKLSFTLILAAALCFAACGNNSSKKAEAAAVETECTDSCCAEKATKSCSDTEATKSCCDNEAAKSGCGGDEKCGGSCEGKESKTEAGCGGNCEQKKCDGKHEQKK